MSALTIEITPFYGGSCSHPLFKAESVTNRIVDFCVNVVNFKSYRKHFKIVKKLEEYVL